MSDKKRNLLILGIMVVLLGISVFIIYPPAKKTKLGLDLQGGLEVTLQAKGNVTSEQMDQAEMVIRNRVDKLGISEPSISTENKNEISVALPGVKNQAQALALIGKTAQLTFQRVDQNLTSQVLAGTLTPAKIPADKQLLFQPVRDSNGNIQKKNGKEEETPIVVDKTPLMTGGALDNASVGYDSFNRPQVNMSFNSKGAQQFADVTDKLATEGAITGQTQRMAIVLDGEVESAPTVKEKITGGQAEITGNMSLQEVKNTVLVLQTGALPVTLQTIQKQEVSATLGAASLRQGLIAGAVGLAIVMAFLIFYYRLLGVVADLALIIYGVMFYAALTNPWHPATLTLPGIAGMVLTVGVAADANVVIFERIKEEVRLGKTIRSAVNSGYSKGFKTILDANAVTIITALIIFSLATAGVKGFALTLIIGVVISMFTAIVATRAMLGLLANMRIFNSPTLMGIKMKKPEAKLS
ncbi:MAG: protein translocase subunit SecD [Actinobacteria bacterium]|nr:protein translocase subunit SecD [Actinomycetota bacterium]